MSNLILETGFPKLGFIFPDVYSVLSYGLLANNRFYLNDAFFVTKFLSNSKFYEKFE